MRIVLSGGGTGGHITPILAIAKALKRHKATLELVYVGEGSAVERQLLSEQPLIQRRIWAGKWRRYADERRLVRLLDVKTNLLNLRDALKVGVGIAQSSRLLRRLKPAAVFIKGGYVGLPVGLAAAVLRIPLVLHESDAVAGITNRLLGRYASAIATGLPVKYYPQWRGKAVYTGIPIRADDTATPVQARHNFKLAGDLPVILIFGGSSGAHVLNEAVKANLAGLLAHYQVIHITGQADFHQIGEWLQTQDLPHQGRYNMYSFLPTKLGQAIAAADIVVSRAGMSAIAEIAHYGKPLIIVPAPQLSGGHQLRNAAILKRRGAAVVIDQKQLPEQLPKQIKQLLRSQRRRNELAANLKQLSQPDAAEAVAELLLELL